MSDFKIKKFEPDDWQDYKSIRLEAIDKHPNYFCPSRDETKFSESDWKERINNPNAAAYGLYDPSGKIIGLTAVVRDGNSHSASKAQLVSSYIREEYRGNGFSRLFYEARIEWAKNQCDIDTLVVEHAVDNFASQGAHKKFSFFLVESKDHTWPNGETKKCLVHHLKLDTRS